MEKLFLSPAKSPLYNLEPFGYLLRGSLELGEKKLRAVQSLAAESSQTAEQSPPLPPTKHTWWPRHRALSCLGDAGQEKPKGEWCRGPGIPWQPQT